MIEHCRQLLAQARKDFLLDPNTFVVMDPVAEFLRHQAGNVTSQNGEDGLLAALFSRIGITNRWCFEVGAHNGHYLSNTWLLREDSWQAVLIEGDPSLFASLKERFDDTAIVVEAMIGPNSLDRILAEVACPDRPDLGVIDIDGPDIEILRGLVYFRPRVLLVEINPAGDGILGGLGVWQAGWESVAAVAEKKRYRPLLRTGSNLLLLDEAEAAFLTRQQRAW